MFTLNKRWKSSMVLYNIRKLQKTIVVINLIYHFFINEDQHLIKK